MPFIPPPMVDKLPNQLRHFEASVTVHQNERPLLPCLIIAHAQTEFQPSLTSFSHTKKLMKSHSDTFVAGETYQGVYFYWRSSVCGRHVLITGDSGGTLRPVLWCCSPTVQPRQSNASECEHESVSRNGRPPVQNNRTIIWAGTCAYNPTFAEWFCLFFLSRALPDSPTCHSIFRVFYGCLSIF